MLSPEQLQQFDRDGFLVMENFISLDKANGLREECDRIIESNHFAEEVSKISVFSAAGNDTEKSDQYFLTSTDKIRPFLEEQAIEYLTNAKEFNSNELTDSTGKKKILKKNIFNKIGHALHALNPSFKEVTFDDNVKQVFKSIGYKKPVVCQSMYIFKQPFIGGEVTIHQDGSYLHVTPLKVCGIWIALEDCTLENGCLSFIPGSNKWPLSRRFIRNPNKEEFNQGKYLIYDGESPKYDESKFVAVPIKAGSAILIDGLVVHRSGANFSPKSRHIYTFHVYESDNATFSKENWMEYSPISFLPLYE